MKTKFCGIALLALMLTGTGMLSYAQGPGGWGRGGDHEMAALLNLTPAQKQQIKTMREAQKATIRPLMQQMEQIRVSMLNATAKGAFDQATIQNLANQQAQIMAEMTVQRQSLRSQIYNQVLTAQQKAMAEQLRQNEITQINEHLSAQSGSATPAQ